jgi:hypothetical protein
VVIKEQLIMLYGLVIIQEFSSQLILSGIKPLLVLE